MTNTSSASQSSLPTKTFQVDALAVRCYCSSSDLARDAALLARDYLESTIAQRGSAAVLLATGNSQIRFLEAVIGLGGVDWSKITFFHLDEYLGIDAAHAASFRRYLHERVEIPVKPLQFHYINGDALEPLAECDRYAQLLMAQPIDLCCLGLGENGHLAFNEPPVADFNDPRAIKLVKLDRSTRLAQVDRGHFPHLEAVPQYAFTLTLPSICSARKILCLAPGKHKNKAVKQMLAEPTGTKCPASVLRTQAQATLFLDTDSANLL